jgi:hypothetical protein
VRQLARDGAVLAAAARKEKNERKNFMNAYKQLLPRTILLGSMGLAAMLLVSTPSCKAQEVSPDHFTDTGVQDVYDAAPGTVAAPAMKQTQAASQASAHRMNAAANTQSASKRKVVLSAKLDTPAVADRRKSVAGTLPKQ